jgi:hypothetical protein
MSQSQSIIGSFNDYFMTFTSKEVQLTDRDSWGWFVDIDIYNNPFKNGNGILDKKYSKIFSKNVEILPTINELPSIRSMKSMKNLADMESMYEFDDIFVKNIYKNDKDKNDKDKNDKDKNDKDKNDKDNENTIFNIICVIGVISLYYLLIVL